ncbi:MAG: hypothetical protein ACRBCJ_04285 [Hyphomicrobiaceae bacterium]
MSSVDTMPPSYAPIWGHYQALGTSLDPATARMLLGMPEEVRYSFTPAQLNAFIAANKAPPANHAFDYSVSLPWFGSWFYLRLFVGRERRNRSRLTAEGQISLPKTSIAFVFVVWLFCCLSLFGSVIVLYLIKSTMGIDFMSGPSIFHPLFFN